MIASSLLSFFILQSSSRALETMLADTTLLLYHTAAVRTLIFLLLVLTLCIACTQSVT
jgi:hypothetical protein